MKHLLISILISWFALPVEAQTNCYFKIDTDKILNNKNLDFFIRKMESDSFKFYRDKNKIPPFVREQLTCLIGDSLLANPNETWNSSDVYSSDKYEVRRQIVFYAESKEVFIVGYYQGGIATFRHIIFMLFWDKRLIDLWSSYPSNDIKQFENVKNILKYIQDNKNKKYELNSNFIGY